MPFRKTVRLALALGALSIAPLYAQSTSINPNVKNPNTPVPDTSATTSTMSSTTTSTGTSTGSSTSTTTTSSSMGSSMHSSMHSSTGSSMHSSMGTHKGPGGRPMSKNSLWADSTRIAALLQDAQSSATVNAAAWKTVANEANALANRIYTRTAGKKDARGLATNLRTHVRKLHEAAMAGDAAGVKTHASQALPYATQLADWSAPPQRM